MARQGGGHGAGDSLVVPRAQPVQALTDARNPPPELARTSEADDAEFGLLLRRMADAHNRQVAALKSQIGALQGSESPGGRQSWMPPKEVREIAVQTDSENMSAGPPESDRPLDSMNPVEELAIPGQTPPPSPPGRNSRNYQTGNYNDFAVRVYERSESFMRPTMNAPVTKKVRYMAARLINWMYFDFVMGAIIIINSFCIGLELHLILLDKDATPLLVMEYIFLMIYIIEFTLRFTALGKRAFRDYWVIFDFALVVLGVASFLASTIIGKESDDMALRGLDLLEVFRLLRLLRLVRAVRMLGMWRSLWKLLSGAVGGLGTLASTFVTLICFVYLFSCIAAELIPRDQALKEDTKAKVAVDEFFGTFPKVYMSILQFATMDGLREMYYPIIMARPAYAIYFLLVFMFISILVMNLVTAVLVDDAISRTRMDDKMQTEHRRRQVATMEPQIRAAFQTLDADGSGSVAANEILSCDFRTLGSGFHDVAHILKPEILMDLYDVLDADGSGFITEDELVQGVMQMALAETSFEIAQVKQLVKANSKQVRQMKSVIDKLGRKILGASISHSDQLGHM